VKPTRAELRDTKRKLDIVRQGHKLLQRKQESLMVELFRALDRYKKQEAATTAAHKNALKESVTAEMAAGRHGVWGYAMTRAGHKGVDMKQISYMGVRLPEFKLGNMEVEPPIVPGEHPQNYGASKASEDFLAHCAAQAEIEAVVMALVNEIERTKRRVNALELKVIPQLEEESVFIMSRLEEMERESLFSLKRIRAKLANR
ncbi:MAG: V-type ATP synthase subunit D, partial [Planctomycetes bacterium]|nr:V-type ATP synthase subunit D [Planctomycetota bacterium]